MQVGIDTNQRKKKGIKYSNARKIDAFIANSYLEAILLGEKNLYGLSANTII